MKFKLSKKQSAKILNSKQLRPDTLEDRIESKLEEAQDAYDRYMDLRNELIEMDELAADKLADWVEQHEG